MDHYCVLGIVTIHCACCLGQTLHLRAESLVVVGVGGEHWVLKEQLLVAVLSGQTSQHLPAGVAH